MKMRPLSRRAFQEFKRHRKRMMNLIKYTPERGKLHWRGHREDWKQRRRRQETNPYAYLYNFRSWAEWFTSQEFVKLYGAYLKVNTMNTAVSDDTVRKRPVPKGARAQAKVAKVMSEYKEGTLKSSSGETVTNPKQGIAIALSEARRAKK